MNKSLFSTFGTKLRQMLLAVFATAVSTTGFSQSTVTFNDASAGANTLSGSFTGGTTSITFTGGTMPSPSGQFRSPAIDYSTNPASINNVAGNQTFSTSFADVYSSVGQYKNVTFTFSTPVIINELNIADIDRNAGGIGNWNDNFQFSGVAFTSVTNVNANATTTGSGSPSQYQVNSINAEYARFQTSTAAVTSFTINFVPVSGLSTAYLQYSLKVTPAAPAATQPAVQNIANQCPSTTVNLNNAITNSASTPSNATIRFFHYPNYPALTPSTEITGTNITQYATAGTVEAIYYYPGTNTWGGQYGSFFNVDITNPCPVNTINMHGSIFHDNNGNTDNLINNGPKISTANGQQLYAVVYRVSDMTVLASQAIVNGDYNINLPQNTTGGNYVLVLTTQNPVVGSIVSNTFVNGQLPSGWMYSSGQFDAFPIITGGSPYWAYPGTVNAEYNFGIQQAPILNNITTNVPQPANGTISAGNVTAAVAGNDSDGTNPNATNQILGNGNAYTISNPTNGRMFYNGTEVLAGGLPITNFNPALVSFSNLANGTTSTSFTYSYIDAAGASANGTYTINWSAPLPLNLLSFTANPKNCDILLNWATENEVHVNRFEIQMGNDGNTFNTIGSIFAMNNSSTKTVYNFNTVQSENIAYYRLKMIDNDGIYSYSIIEKVNTFCNGITLQPTLTNDIVSVKGLNGGEKVQVISIDGKVVLTTTAQSHETQINLSQFAAGQYLILISKNNTLIYTGKVNKL